MWRSTINIFDEVWDIRKLKEGKNPDSVKSIEMTVYSRKTFFKTTIGMVKQKHTFSTFRFELSTVGLTDGNFCCNFVD